MEPSSSTSTSATKKKHIERTIYLEQALTSVQAITLYDQLRQGIEWEQGVRSKQGFTRKAKAIDLFAYPNLTEIVHLILNKIQQEKNVKAKVIYEIYGTYLNYYQDGNMWTPNHSHPGTSQLIISLGATRTLVLGKKEYQMKNGDAILFGSSVHGVPKDPTVKDGRISIATFMRYVDP